MRSHSATIHLKQVTKSSPSSREGELDSTFCWEKCQRVCSYVLKSFARLRRGFMFWRIYPVSSLIPSLKFSSFSSPLLSSPPFLSSFLSKLIYRYWLPTASQSIHSKFKGIYRSLKRINTNLFCYSSGGQKAAVSFTGVKSGISRDGSFWRLKDSVPGSPGCRRPPAVLGSGPLPCMVPGSCCHCHLFQFFLCHISIFVSFKNCGN